MIPFTTYTGLFGIGFAMAALVVALPFVRGLPPVWRSLAWFLGLIAGLAPIGALSAAFCVRGAVGDLSITTLVLLGSFVMRAIGGLSPLVGRGRWVVLAAIAIAALGLYPMALGVGMYDPYRLGYGSPFFVTGLITAALAAWFARLELLALCMGLALLAWAGGWYESTNLWDYLIDPLVSLYALGALIGRGVRQLGRASRRTRA